MEECKVKYKILIAFSGSKKVHGVEYTESSINGFPESETADTFENDDYRILVVANKYLTGFDQKKLCAMYIDKRLGGVLAVQALSRLNRAAPELNKRTEDLFVLDFFNKTDEIKKAFDPYFTGTVLEEATDVNVLSDIRRTLLDQEVFTQEEVHDFMQLYVTGAEADKLAPYIDHPAHRFNVSMEWDNDTKIDFKMKCKQFVRVYSRMAAIIPFEMPEWEELYWFLKLLIPELKVKTATEDLKELLDSVDLSTYGLRRTSLSQNIELDSNTSEISPTSPTMVNGGEGEPEHETLDDIIQAFNQKWFDGWKNTPEEQKVKVTAIAHAIAENEDYKERVVGNQDTDAADRFFFQLIQSYMIKKRKDDMSLYKQFRDNPEFAADFTALIRRSIDRADYLMKL
jgi:type I restriction enzyme R subunit